MRWFKHMSNSHNDEKLAVILDEFGPEGYGVWWLLIETIAKEMDKSDKCSLVYPMAKWAKSLCCSKKKAAGFLKKFSEIPEDSEKKLIFLEYHGEKFVGKLGVKVPNILKYRDEYSKKSGQAPDKKPTNSGAKIEIETQIEIENKPLQVSEVRTLYLQYAGLTQEGNGQVVVFQDIAKKYTRETVVEAFQSAAANNVSARGFLTWCIKRMDRTEEPTIRKKPLEVAF